MRDILVSQTFSRGSVSQTADTELAQTALANFAGYATRA